MLTLFRPKLTLSSPYVGPMVAYVAIASANPHSSDRNDGGDRNGGGRDGVGRGWERGGNDSVGGRGDRPYNLRLPTEGLRHGHGLWPAPGFKG